MYRKNLFSNFLPLLLMCMPFVSLSSTAQSRLTYEADGSVNIQSFSVRTVRPGSKVTVKFPDGVVAEAVSDEEYRLTKFAHRIKDTPAPWKVEITTDGFSSFASQQTGIQNIDLSACKELIRLTLPYQKLVELNLSGLNNLQELYLYGNIELHSLDVSDLVSLNTLNISNTEGLIPNGLDRCTSLTSLYAYNSSLSSPNLSTLTHLRVLDLTNTQTSTIDLSKNEELVELQLTDNQLTRVKLDQLKNLEKLLIGSNRLETLDLSKNAQLVELNINDNQLQELNIGSEHLSSLDCGKNRLPISQLPIRGNLTTYIYWPQKDFVVSKQVEVGQPLDLNKEAEAQGVAQTKKKTTFFVYDAKGNMLSEGEDYTCDKGVFTFLKSFENALRIKIKTAAFPKLIDKNALYSTFFHVVPVSTGIVSVDTTSPLIVRTNKGTLTLFASSDFVVSIYQTDGKLLSRFALKKDVSRIVNLPHGTYLVRAKNETKKVVVP